MIDVITRINVSDFDLNLVTASILPSIQDVRELHALSPPKAARYALGIGCGGVCSRMQGDKETSCNLLTGSLLLFCVLIKRKYDNAHAHNNKEK